MNIAPNTGIDTDIDTGAKSRLNVLQAAFVVARRDFTAILFSKAFGFFLLGPLLFIGISVAAGALGAKAADSIDPPQLAIALEAVEAQALTAAHGRLEDAANLPAIVVLPGDTNLDSVLRDTDRNIGAVIGGTLAAPTLTGTPDSIERWSGRVALMAANASGASAILPPVTARPIANSTANTRSANTATATAALTLLFLLTMLLAGMVLSNLVEEKANKIIEILAAAIPMDAVFMGKLFAMLGVSFVGIAVWGSVVGIILAVGAGALPPLPPPAVGWPIFVGLFVIYFAMAYCLVGSIFLAVGSMAPTVRDVQTISMPATILQLIVFFLATYAMTDIGSPVELFAVIFPLSSPYAMVARAAQEPALWPHAVALAWQAAAVVVFVKGGATLFRTKVMKSGPQGANRKRFGFLPAKAGAK